MKNIDSVDEVKALFDSLDTSKACIETYRKQVGDTICAIVAAHGRGPFNRNGVEVTFRKSRGRDGFSEVVSKKGKAKEA